MAEPEKPVRESTASVPTSTMIDWCLQSGPPESPTTARPLDFDDEPQESGLTGGSAPGNQTSPRKTEGTAAPPKPPRPLNPQEQAMNTLKEAFPSIDASVVKAVLQASGGQVEAAFNALLGEKAFVTS